MALDCNWYHSLQNGTWIKRPKTIPTYIMCQCITQSRLTTMERVAGIEPASSAWKAEVIAIIRYPHMVPTTGIELVT